MGDLIKDVMRIECPATTAFDLMADIRSELDWNSGVSEVELLTPEPIGKGSRFRIVDKRGQHDVEITTYKRPDTLSLVVSDKSMDVNIDFTLVEQGNITVMTGRFNAKVRGLMRFFFHRSLRSQSERAIDRQVTVRGLSKHRQYEMNNSLL